MSLQVRVKFPADYPVIYKTIRLDPSLTVLEAIAAIGQAINVNPAADIGLFLPEDKACLQDTRQLSSYTQITQAQYIELKSKKQKKDSCCTIM
ncbi:hypothetical protein DFA_03094 [Cavenderia fasciculata]|uniref:Ubiquitin-like domain-containing protein n=1 Tax=Cavenderia fasciculata TaxID=261658 RepID=F4PGL5_CACFS|nr:uncharacterized protein DFA_03094 [Cavenderia fasciculata]EGG24849.1 hypothetical protein DFA_03094 [Cavenderia fasciculata]|eukprot:XP_004362700.1 hypothetical protein DFA_03094 [Cavenderia fasciculata]